MRDEKTRDGVKKCSTSYRNTKLRLVENKRKIIELLGGKCEMCGISGLPPYCYDLHHEDPDKKYREGAALLHLKWERILLELSCVKLLCACCHRIHHREDEYGQVPE